MNEKNSFVFLDNSNYLLNDTTQLFSKNGIASNQDLFRLNDRNSIDKINSRSAFIKRQKDIFYDKDGNNNHHTTENKKINFFSDSIRMIEIKENVFKTFFLSLNILGIYILLKIIKK